MEKNQIIELRTEDMLDDGRAFGRYEGCAVFVSGGAVPGDVVKARVTKAKKTSAEAELTEIVEKSPDRIIAECLKIDIGSMCMHNIKPGFSAEGIAYFAIIIFTEFFMLLRRNKIRSGNLRCKEEPRSSWFPCVPL